MLGIAKPREGHRVTGTSRTSRDLPRPPGGRPAPAPSAQGPPPGTVTPRLHPGAAHALVARSKFRIDVATWGLDDSAIFGRHGSPVSCCDPRRSHDTLYTDSPKLRLRVSSNSFSYRLSDCSLQVCEVAAGSRNPDRITLFKIPNKQFRGRQLTHTAAQGNNVNKTELIKTFEIPFSESLKQPRSAPAVKTSAPPEQTPKILRLGVAVRQTQQDPVGKVGVA